MLETSIASFTERGYDRDLTRTEMMQCSHRLALKCLSKE